MTVTGTVTDGSGHGWPLYARIDIAGHPGSPVYTDPQTGQYAVELARAPHLPAHRHRDQPRLPPGGDVAHRPVDPGAARLRAGHRRHVCRARLHGRRRRHLPATNPSTRAPSRPAGAWSTAPRRVAGSSTTRPPQQPHGWRRRVRHHRQRLLRHRRLPGHRPDHPGGRPVRRRRPRRHVQHRLPRLPQQHRRRRLHHRRRVHVDEPVAPDHRRPPRASGRDDRDPRRRQPRRPAPLPLPRHVGLVVAARQRHRPQRLRLTPGGLVIGTVADDSHRHGARRRDRHQRRPPRRHRDRRRRRRTTPTWTTATTRCSPPSRGPTPSPPPPAGTRRRRSPSTSSPTASSATTSGSAHARPSCRSPMPASPSPTPGPRH